ASKVKLFNALSSQLFGDSVGLREDHGEASQVNVVESRSVNDELRLLERSWTRSPPNGASKFSTYACSYCGKPGHKAEFCWTRLQLNTGKPAMIITEETNTSPVGVMAGLSKADSMSIGLISKKGEARESAVSVLASRDFDLFQESFAKDPDVGTFRPFLSQGTVEVDGVKTPVTILRDSGCLQTIINEGVVAARKIDKYVVLGSLWGQGVAPLVLVRAKSSCFSGIANVDCVHELPVAGVDLILSNDLAGGQMGNVTPPPVLRERPESTVELQQLEDDMPGVFPLCVVTRSMSMTNDHNVTPLVDYSLSLEGLFAYPIASQDISSAVNAVTGRVALIAEQEQDDSLRFLFDEVSDFANNSGPTTRYFSDDDRGDNYCTVSHLVISFLTRKIMLPNIMPPSIMLPSIMPHSIMTPSIMQLRIMSHSIMSLNIMPHSIIPPSTMTHISSLNIMPHNIIPQSIMSPSIMPPNIMTHSIMPHSIVPHSIMPHSIMPHSIMPHSIMPPSIMSHSIKSLNIMAHSIMPPRI
ncbi:hypothetical protein Hamer_G002509, partial [Homarus americanus]